MPCHAGANPIPRPRGGRLGMGSFPARLCQEQSLALGGCACPGGILCPGSPAWRGAGGHGELLGGYFWLRESGVLMARGTFAVLALHPGREQRPEELCRLLAMAWGGLGAIQVLP